MLCFPNKKGDMTLKKLVTIILILGSMFVLSGFAIFTTDNVQEKGQEEICRASVFARDEYTIDPGKPGGLIGEQKIVPLQCFSYEREIPDDLHEMSIEGIMGNIGDYAVKCWYMFGEGLYEDTLKDYWGDECHVCYIFTIDDAGIAKSIEESNYGQPGYKRSGDTIFDHSSLQLFLYENLYMVEPELRESYCNNGIDDDDDGYIDSEDPDCSSGLDYVRRNNCEMNGGECISKGDNCPDGLRKYTSSFEFTCDKDDVCCVKKDKSYTYFEYVAEHGYEDGLLLVQNVGNQGFNSGTQYAIAIRIPEPLSESSANLYNQYNPYGMNEDALKDFEFDPEDPKSSLIMIGKLEDIENECEVIRMKG